MIQIAIYGKGGIGKSTVSSNISYSLSQKGKKVLQIGCDPKHDSTRALLAGKEQSTVLNYIRNTPPYDRHLEDIVLDGVNGIKCVEAGGPEPGIGCAGRGILSTFDTLKKLGLDDMCFDVKLYDVLGDVVCGGFAVPLRNEYADGVYLVTSGEFMSLYAANNILKGISNFDRGIPRVAGIILNCRGADAEYDTVKRFADAVDLPIVACIPRSKLFADAERAGKTVMEMFPDSDVAYELNKISENILNIVNGKSKLLDSKPLNDHQMEQIAKGETVRNSTADLLSIKNEICRTCARTTKEKVTTEEKILSSCATSGAVHGCSSVIDSIVIIHGPRSCAHIMSSSKNLSEIKRRSNHIHNFNPQSMRIISTDMDDTVSVFGGAGLLEQKIRDSILEGHHNIFIVTSCVSGIIGDNVIDVVNAISNEHPDMYFRVVEADGNILGDWEAGYIESANALLDMVNNTLEPEMRKVNILAERYFFKQGENKDNEIFDLFRPYGIEVNCRFMYESSMESICNFRLGKMNYIVDSDRGSIKIAQLVKNKLNVPVDFEPLPIGIREYRRFSEKIGKQFNISDIAEKIANDEEKKYDSEISKLRTKLVGKRIIIEDKFTQNVDWLIELVLDLGMEIIVVGVGPVYYWKEKRQESIYVAMGIKFKHNYRLEEITSDIVLYSPDIVASDSGLTELDGVYHMTYSRPGPGLNGVLAYGRKFVDLISVPKKEGWRDL
ncbi:MAG: AAA family ATPase [Candidatus Methanogranum gryphiswaldense]|nr:MAG: AAA family ATPase [Candidatus Methanogranum sp. U3.2.1]